jgi:hypothetical protein
MNIVSGYFSQNNFANWVSVTLVALVGVFLFRTFRRWYRLRHFKGPLIATLSRIWLARHVAGGRMHLDFQEVNQKYGMFEGQMAYDPRRWHPSSVRY